MKNIFLFLSSLYFISCKTNPKELSMNQQAHLLNESSTIQTKTLQKLSTLYKNDPSISDLHQLDVILNEIETLNAIAHFFQYVHDQKETKTLAARVYEETKNFIIEKIYNQDLYNYIKKYTSFQLENEDLQFVQSLVLDLKKSGLDKENFSEISKKFIERETIKTKMSQQLLQANTETIKLKDNELEGLPPHIIDKNNKEGLSISIASDIQGVLKFSENADVRKKFYIASNKRGKINENDFKTYLRLSQEYAKMLDFQDFTSYTLSSRMVENKENFFELQKKIEIPLKKKFQQDSDLLKKEFNLTSLNPWDISHYTSRYSKKYFNIDPLELRQYFEMDFVLNRLLEIYTSTFQLRFEKKLLSSQESWTKDPIYEVTFYDQDKKLGTLFLDLFPRPKEQKYGHFAQFTLTKRTENTLASCAIVGNFQRKTEQEPSLLSYSEVNTLAHELGHAFHTITSNVNYYYLSGTNVKHDFVEVPSQLFEKWLDDLNLFRSLSSHYKTKEPISEKKFKELKESLKFFHSLKYLNQLKMSEADLRLFSGESMENPQKLFHSLLSEVLNIPKDLYTLYSFEHLFGGYEAGYYGYLWSEVIVEDLNSQFKDNYTNQDLGKKFKETILSQGAKKEPQDLLKDFLGRSFNSDAFISYINE